MYKIVLEPVQLLEIGNILNGDRRPDIGDRRILTIEDAAIVKIDLVIFQGTFTGAAARSTTDLIFFSCL